MDRARPAKYLRPGYEDEESGVLFPLRTFSRGWLDLRKFFFESTHFLFSPFPPSLPPFPLSVTLSIYYVYRSLSFPKRHFSLNRCPSQTHGVAAVVLMIYQHDWSVRLNFARDKSLRWFLYQKFIFLGEYMFTLRQNGSMKHAYVGSHLTLFIELFIIFTASKKSFLGLGLGFFRVDFRWYCCWFFAFLGCELVYRLQSR